MHSIKIDEISLLDLVEFIRFLCYDGKAGISANLLKYQLSQLGVHGEFTCMFLLVLGIFWEFDQFVGFGIGTLVWPIVLKISMGTFSATPYTMVFPKIRSEILEQNPCIYSIHMHTPNHIPSIYYIFLVELHTIV